MTKHVQTGGVGGQGGHRSLAELAVHTLGPHYIDDLHESSRKILGLGIDRALLLQISRILREDIGGLARGEQRLFRRGGLLAEHMQRSLGNRIPTQLIECMPESISTFLKDEYPPVLDQSGKRLVHLIAASYALDRAVMDFHPTEPEKSHVAKTKDIVELSRKMVLVVGATAVGKDTVRNGLIKELHPDLRIDQRIDRDTLLVKAEEIGIYMPVKLTGRPSRTGETHMVDYVYFDGKDGRPSEAKLASLCHDGENTLYSYLYSGHTYSLASKTMPPEVSGMQEPVMGLLEKLQDERVRMILCGGGTTPEAVYFKQMFPNATIVYLLATPEEAGLLTMEREVGSRWWGRSIGELMTPVQAGIARLEGAVNAAIASGSTDGLLGAMQSPEVFGMHLAIPEDTTSFGADIEEKLRSRLIQVMPQVGQALMIGPQMDFVIVPNERGRLEVGVHRIRNTLRQRGVIAEDV
ncbi:MAG: hypothetical protein ABH834_05245 [Candidatus Altiarchaeota archaeon]